MTVISFTLSAKQATSVASFANIVAGSKEPANVLQHAKITLSPDGLTITATDRYVVGQTMFDPSEFYGTLPETPVDILVSADTLKLMKSKYAVHLKYDTETKDLTVEANNTVIAARASAEPERYPDTTGFFTEALETPAEPVATYNLNFALLNKVSKLVSSTDYGKHEPRFTMTQKGANKPIMFKRANLSVLVQPMRTEAKL